MEAQEAAPTGDGKPRPLNVLICVPTIGQVESGFAYSLTRAMSFFTALPYEGEKKVDVTFVKSSNLAESRTRLVSRAFMLEASHIMWFDSDMKFPPDIIPALLNHNVPVVAVNYSTKEDEARPTAYADNDVYTGPVWTTEKETGIAEVSHCGMGAMLTDIKVFENLELPYFHFEPAPPDFVHTTGEDVFFCRKVRAAGMPIYIDHDVSKKCAHIGTREYLTLHAQISEEVKQALYREME